MMDIYQKELMDHFHYPRRKAVLENPDFDTGQYNPSCGDAVRMYGLIKDGILADVSFKASGCVISQAAASMICDYAYNRPIEELVQFNADDMSRLIKIPLGPVRLKCALLTLHALKDGIDTYQKGVRCSIMQR